MAIRSNHFTWKIRHFSLASWTEFKCLINHMNSYNNYELISYLPINLLDSYICQCIKEKGYGWVIEKSICEESSTPTNSKQDYQRLLSSGETASSVMLSDHAWQNWNTYCPLKIAVSFVQNLLKDGRQLENRPTLKKKTLKTNV